MKHSHLKKLIKEVVRQLNESHNPESWRKHEFPSGEPPEPIDNPEEGPEPEEPLQDRIDQLESILKKLEAEDIKEKSGTPNSQKLHGKIQKVLSKLIELYTEREHGVNEDHGMGFGHNVSIPQDTNTMNKSTISRIK